MSNMKHWTERKIENSMMGFLGIEILPSEGGVLKARMPVTGRVAQPFGVMCGGASLAMAEIVAGIGSFKTCKEDELPVGSNVYATHISPASLETEKFVYAYATCIHKGRTTHVWNVDIKTEAGKLVSTISVTNFIVKDKTTK